MDLLISQGRDLLLAPVLWAVFFPMGRIPARRRGEAPALSTLGIKRPLAISALIRYLFWSAYVRGAMPSLHEAFEA